MGLLRTLLILAIIYFGFRFLARFLLPYLLRLFIQKQQSSYSQHTQRKEGDIHVETNGKSKKDGRNLGEYVDYEEVEDE